jgi:N-acetylglucosaminyl-diphospho-decaprenol L-rhamnosyltransferase
VKATHPCCVVVVGYHGANWLPDCLTSLARASERRLQLVLVDNGGNGDLDRLPLAAFETQVVRTPSPMGFADANNFGLVASGFDAEAVCFLNQDTISGPGWLDACLGCLNEDPSIGAVSPLLTTIDGSAWDEGFAHCVRNVPELKGVSPGNAIQQSFEVPQITGAAMVVRSKVLHCVGPFDPIFGSYYEDFDLCRRVREAGYRIVACPGVVRHAGGSSTKTQAQQHNRMRLIVRNRAIERIREARSRRLGPVMRQFAVTFPRNLLRGVARTASSQPVSVQLRAHLDLVRMLPRLISEQRDNATWCAYLRRIGWNSDGFARELREPALEQGAPA